MVVVAGVVASAAAEDNLVYADNGVIRVGMSLERGGSIAYLVSASEFRCSEKKNCTMLSMVIVLLPPRCCGGC
jgi:hypothetical protein